MKYELNSYGKKSKFFLLLQLFLLSVEVNNGIHKMGGERTIQFNSVQLDFVK